MKKNVRKRKKKKINRYIPIIYYYIMSNTYTAYICMPKRHSFPLSPYVQAVSRRYFISMQLQYLQ